MKQFFKFMFASMLGFFLSLGIIFVILAAIIASLASFAKKEVVVSEKTILTLTLDKPIPERTKDNPFESMDFPSLESNIETGLQDIVECIGKAAGDDNIKGIYLDLGDVPSGMATVEAVRQALLEFRESGKFIVSYGEVYSQKAYYLASVADKIYLNPEGQLIFKGLGGELMFFKGTLDKLDIDAQIIRHGKYKSAVEPFMLDKMSAENREQTEAYVMALWNHMVKGISERRGLAADELNSLADKLVEKPDDALKAGLVDSLLYKDGLLAQLRKLMDLGEDAKIKSIGPGRYKDVKVKGTTGKSGKDRIAVVYAYGSVVDGEGGEDAVGGERISRAIRKARLDKKVKAIVLRVNSPGGSALASEVILREVLLAKEEKPVVASFGDVAASGGYYISCGATKIICQPNTITGSIGVLGIIPNFQNMMKNKLGITTDQVKSNENADYIPVTRPLTAYQEAVLTRQIENIYETFVNHVAKGRNMSFAAVDSIGQGRVWSGTDAKRIGLVDDFGGLDKAIRVAAELAKTEEYRVTYLPALKDPFQQIMDQLSGEEKKDIFLREQLGENYRYVKALRDLRDMQGIQARMPFEIDVR